MEIPVVSREEVKSLIDSEGNYVLIDVRQLEELQYGMIPTAHNVPLDELEEAFAMNQDAFGSKYGFSQPGRNTLVIFYCRTGGRSQRATEIALTMGFKNVKNYAGSAYDWSEIDSRVQKY